MHYKTVRPTKGSDTPLTAHQMGYLISEAIDGHNCDGLIKINIAHKIPGTDHTMNINVEFDKANAKSE